MKCIPVHQAVGSVLCHDITEIVPDGHKGPAFRRGHVVRQEDVPRLLRLGKEHLYVCGGHEQGMVHEDEAAGRISAAAAGPGIVYGSPTEGRINFSAAHQGLLRINTDLLERLHDIPHVTVATLHSLQEVSPGRPVAGTRVIPLAVPEQTVAAVEAACAAAHEPLLSVLPLAAHRVGIVTTGSEVFQGRIRDGFGPVLRQKFADWGSEVICQELVPDTAEVAAAAICRAVGAGATLVAVTGGMSVDPDDRTPAAISSVCDRVVVHGAPVFPGAMFMLAYRGPVPVLGLPGCVMYHRASLFDIVAPRLLAGLPVTRRDIARLAHGGLCEGCSPCTYPSCSFGKG